MNIKLTEQDFIDCDINEQDCITLKKILVYSQQSAFPEQNVYRLIFVKEIPIELSTDIEQNLFRVLKEWSCDYDGNSDEVAVSKMQKIAEEFAIKYSWWKSAIRTENHKISPQYFIIEGEGLQKTVELKPDRDLLIIYKEFLKNEKT
jgi:hypothetical protein